MSSIEKIIKTYTSKNYGHIIVADPPIYNEEKNTYTSNLRANYPLIIKNEKPPERKTMHLLKINSLGKITIDKSGKIIKEQTTQRDDCITNIQLFLERWKRRTEEIVVYTTLDKIIKGSRQNHYLTPINEIISNLWEYESINEIEIDAGRDKKRRQKTRQYLNLLEGLDIVQKQGKNFIEGNLTVSVRQEAKGNKRYFKDLLISTIFKERYTALRDVFKLTVFEPMIRIEKCIYFQEIEMDDQIYRGTDSINREIKQNYRRVMNNDVLKRNLEQLVDFEVIEQSGQYFYGREDLRKTMIQRKNETMTDGDMFSIPQIC